jgi:predicted MFS family arabinose efflux permease
VHNCVSLSGARKERLITSPLAAWLVSHHDWRTSMQIVALMVASIMIPVSLLVRRPPGLDAAPAAPGHGGAPQDQSASCSATFW